MRWADWTGRPGVVGARLMLVAQEFQADDPGPNRILAAGGQAGVPVNVMSSGKLPLLLELARRNPNTQIVIDHLGIAQPFEPPAPAVPFAEMDNILALAECDNVAIKISGACTLSHEPFPIPRHLGAPPQNIRRLRLRTLHVGHRLDPCGKRADLRAGSRSIPGYRPAFRLRAFHPHGRNAVEDIQMVSRNGYLGNNKAGAPKKPLAKAQSVTALTPRFPKLQLPETRVMGSRRRSHNAVLIPRAMSASTMRKLGQVSRFW